MGCENDEITLKSGRNIWVLARTDRDGADLETVLQTAGAVLSRFLGRASPSGTRSIFEVLQSPKGEEDTARFVIGAARPVVVEAFQADSPETALQQRPLLSEDEPIARFEECPTIRTVKAERPWYVTAEFDWRAPTTKAAWPRRAVGPLGFPVDTDHGLDWLLLSAAHRGPAEESDTDLLDEVSGETGELIEEAAKSLKKHTAPILWTLAAVGAGGVALYLIHRQSQKRKTAA